MYMLKAKELKKKKSKDGRLKMYPSFLRFKNIKKHGCLRVDAHHCKDRAKFCFLLSGEEKKHTPGGINDGPAWCT